MIDSKQRGFVICTEPRSGSNFFCQLLASTGVLGRPLEYFNTLGRRAFDDPDYPQDPEVQLQLVLDRGATSNGVYGVKIFSRDFDRLSTLKWAERLPNLDFIHLQRRDVLGQAISRVRAEQTGRFRSYAEGSGGTERYDPRAIATMLKEILVGNARWTAYFAQAGIEPLLIVYEDLVRNPCEAIKLTSDRLFVANAAVNMNAVYVKIQQDDITNIWRRRFIDDNGRLDRIPDICDCFCTNGRASFSEFVRRLRMRFG